ncbi:MAG: hypothetical protein LBV58_03615 [Acholeplasmatales bacterium]|nr:hypothetical protein [Acholeplasmatales bacterium]
MADEKIVVDENVEEIIEESVETVNEEKVKEESSVLEEEEVVQTHPQKKEKPAKVEKVKPVKKTKREVKEEKLAKKNANIILDPKSIIERGLRLANLTDVSKSEYEEIVITTPIEINREVKYDQRIPGNLLYDQVKFTILYLYLDNIYIFESVVDNKKPDLIFDDTMTVFAYSDVTLVRTVLKSGIKDEVLVTDLDIELSLTNGYKQVVQLRNQLIGKHSFPEPITEQEKQVIDKIHAFLGK